MREKIEKCIEYLKMVSLKEPTNIRVEETDGDRIVLSFEEKREYTWVDQRQYKVFKLREIEGIYDVESMTNYEKEKPF